MANGNPQITEYAAIDTSIVPDVVNSFSFGSSSRMVLNLARNATIAARIGPNLRLINPGLRGSKGGPSCEGSRPTRDGIRPGTEG